MNIKRFYKIKTGDLVYFTEGKYAYDRLFVVSKKNLLYCLLMDRDSSQHTKLQVPLWSLSSRKFTVISLEKLKLQLEAEKKFQERNKVLQIGIVGTHTGESPVILMKEKK